MKIKSEKLYYLINNGTIKENTKINVYRDDVYITQIIFDGYDFNWENGKLTSGVFFDPLCDFEIIEEPKEIEELPMEKGDINDKPFLAKYITHNRYKINELVREINKLNKENK